MANEPLSTRRLLELMRDLQRVATERKAAEDRIAGERRDAEQAAELSYEEAAEAAESRYAKLKEEAESQADDDRRKLEAEYELARTGAQQEYHGLRSAAESDRKRTSAEAEQRHKDEALVILSTFDAQKGQPRRRYEDTIAKLKGYREELALIDSQVADILASRSLPSWNGSVEPETADKATIGDTDAAVNEPIERVVDATDAAREAAQSIYDQRSASLLETGPLVGVAFGGLVAGAALVGLATAWSLPGLVGGGIGGGVLGFVAIWLGLRPSVRKKSDDAQARIKRAKAAAAAAIEEAAVAAEARSRREARELVDRRDKDLADLGFEIGQLVGDVKARTTEQLKSASEVFPAKLAEFRGQHQEAMAEVETTLRSAVAAATAERDEKLAAAEKAQQADVVRIGEEYDQAWEAMRVDWLAKYDVVRQELDAIRQACDRRFPDFATLDYAAWDKPDEVALGVEFGRTALSLATVKNGLPADERLRPEQTRFELPAMITLAEQPSMVITADGQGRDRAEELMLAVMLRWITGQPPGKVRFTILDPVGRGEAFNSLMHLADHDENLIATRIWSESRDIEEQLKRLTHHMETVLQKYLRSEYESIHDYNEQAGEVAEPFQVLVVNGFPNGFHDDTARRLLSLATSGPRCGVYVVMSVDKRQKVMVDFPMDDLLAESVHLDWQADPSSKGRGRFVWQYPAFGKLPLRLTEAPGPEQTVELLKQVGKAAKDAVRVEVPFDVVAPEDDALVEEDLR